MKPLVLIVVLFLAFVSSPTGAHAQNLSAEIFTIKSLPQAQLGDRRAMVQGANIDALVEEIFKVIKPQQPALQALEIPLGTQTLDKFKEALAAKQASVDFVELKAPTPGAGTAATPGKAGGPRPERIPTQAEQLEPAKRYEAQISKTGYTARSREFAIQPQAGTPQLEFGDARVTLDPAGADSLGFLVDTTALPANSQSSLRETIGKALDMKHHVLRFFPNASLAEVAQIANRPANASVAQGPPPQPPFQGLRYVIKVTR